MGGVEREKEEDRKREGDQLTDGSDQARLLAGWGTSFRQTSLTSLQTLSLHGQSLLGPRSARRDKACQIARLFVFECKLLERPQKVEGADLSPSRTIQMETLLCAVPPPPAFFPRCKDMCRPQHPYCLLLPSLCLKKHDRQGHALD